MSKKIRTNFRDLDITGRRRQPLELPICGILPVSTRYKVSSYWDTVQHTEIQVWPTNMAESSLQVVFFPAFSSSDYLLTKFRQERLREHSQAFDSLLSLIPAKHYYGKDNTSVGTSDLPAPHKY
jgi:hypothetical protein